MFFFQWGLLGREPLDVFRLGAGLWYTDRRDLLTSLYILLRVMYLITCIHNGSFTMSLMFYLFWSLQAVVLDQGLQADLIADIQSYLEDLITSGLRQRLVSLIKVFIFFLVSNNGNEVISFPKILAGSINMGIYTC